jgi:hypothetical protein
MHWLLYCLPADGIGDPSAFFGFVELSDACSGVNHDSILAYKQSLSVRALRQFPQLRQTLKFNRERHCYGLNV